MFQSRKRPQQPIILIPSRMASHRLPRKPLADIHGVPMIVHVLRRAEATNLGQVIVACDGSEIADVVHAAGGKAVITRPDHNTGSDRIWDALNQLPDHANYDAVINVQGDEPTLDPAVIYTAWNLLADPAVDIATVAAEIHDEAKRQKTQVVKAAVNIAPGGTHGRALYFSRLPVPFGDGPVYHHVGLYAYRREALATFVSAPPAPLEKRESLEQLRALSLGMHIEVGIIDAIPMGVDTPEDLELVRQALEKDK